jgi:hypothetical protein
MVRDVRPMLFFGSIALMLMVLALGFGYPVVQTYYEIGLVPRLPTAILVDKIRRMEPTGSTVGRRFRPFGPESSV